MFRHFCCMMIASFSHNAPRHRQMDGQEGRRHYHANSRSYCVQYDRLELIILCCHILGRMLSVVDAGSPVFRGGVSQEVVSCPLNLWKKSELLEDARPDVMEIFPRLEKPDYSLVTRRFRQVLKLPVVPVNN